MMIYHLLFLCFYSAFGQTPDQNLALQKAAHDIPRFEVVDTAKVYRGSRPRLQDIATLKQAGIKTIIDLQGGDYDIFGRVVGRGEPGELPEMITQENIAALNMVINWMPQRLSTFILDESRQERVKAALKTARDPSMQPVYIHCEFGKDRTGLVAALYQVFYLNVSVAAAHTHWVATGHNSPLTRELDEYFFQATSGFPR